MRSRGWTKTKGSMVLMGLLGAVVLAPGQSFADVSAATIRGHVMLNAAPVKAGAQVVATNKESGVSFRTISREDGSYTLTGLKPGSYEVKVTTPDGQEAVQEITIQVGQTASMDIEVGAKIEKITIVGTAALPEAKATEVATYVTPEQIERLPQVTRNFLYFADLAPGVNVTTAQDGSIKLQSGGQRSDNVNVFIDGVSQKNYVLRGGIAGQDSSRGNPFPQSAIGEYKIITQNYKAEFDQVSSAAIVAATKSGTNEFHGEVFYDYTDESMREETPAEDAAGSKVDSEQKQYGFTFSGPIVKDMAHFFMAYEKKKNLDPATVTAGGGTAVPAQYQSLLGPVNRPFEEDLFFGKLDFSPNDRNLFELSYKYRDETEVTNIGGQNTKPYSTDKDNNEKRWDLKHQYTADKWVNELHLTYEDAFWNPRAATTGAGLILESGGGGGILNVGGGRDFQNKGQKGHSVQDDLTLTDLQWQGDHVVKMGAKVKKVDLETEELQPYNPQFHLNLDNPAGTPWKVEFGAQTTAGDGSAKTDATQIGVYVQDDWEINKHLTLNLGLRWDYERIPSYLDHKTPADVAAALRGWANINNPNSGINIEDYISDGSERDTDKNNWAPRLGFAFDVNGNQRHVVFGSYARAYDRNIFDVLQLEKTKGTFPTYSLQFQGDPNHACAPGPTCIPWNPAYLDYSRDQLLALLGGAGSGAGREIDLLNNDLKTPHSDQYSIGMRNRVEFWKTAWNTEVTLSHVRSKDGFVWLLGNRRPDGSFFAPGDSWGSPWGFGVPGFGSLILGTNGVETKTNSLYLKADKPYDRSSKWGVTLAYTFTDSEENKVNSFSDGFSYALDYPNLKGFGWNDTAGVRRHKVVATGTIDLPMDIMFSTKVTVASGETVNGLNCTAGWNACRFDPFRGHNFHQVDIAFSKDFNILFNTKLKFRADVLNIFNTRNYAGYDTWAGAPGPGGANPNYQRHNNDLAGPTRTLKLTAGWEF